MKGDVMTPEELELQRLREHEERYPADFVDKLQQDIDERNVTIRTLKQELELLRRALAEIGGGDE